MCVIGVKFKLGVTSFSGGCLNERARVDDGIFVKNRRFPMQATRAKQSVTPPIAG